MPELPEVETTRRGLMPHAVRHVITKVVVRNPRLRWPVDKLVSSAPCGQTILQLDRRGKYLILVCVCNSGHRSLNAARLLRLLGYEHSFSLAGGFLALDELLMAQQENAASEPGQPS